MRSHQKIEGQKLVLVISDLHLGGGRVHKGRKNFLEDFHSDKELVEFLEFYSTEEYEPCPVELVINGDFLDFLSVPFIDFFDDEYWSEAAALEKLKIIMGAHKEVMRGLVNFVSVRDKKIVYILGNHDAELVFPSVRAAFAELFPPPLRDRFSFHLGEEEYFPVASVAIKHGHEFEAAHRYHPERSLIRSEGGKSYFLPPWGSYYVTRVINKFKGERSFINSIRPIRTFLIYGLIFDTLFTVRFIFANCYYFIMVILLAYFKENRRPNLHEAFKFMLQELVLFRDLEEETQEYFLRNPGVRALIVGHTHGPVHRNLAGGGTFINTGTWTQMFNLDFARKQDGRKLTYAQIAIADSGTEKEVSFSLNLWKGRADLPYADFQ